MICFLESFSKVNNATQHIILLIMPRGGREVTNQGVNSQGNQYTSYNDGGYRYSNKSGDGSRAGIFRMVDIRIIA